MSTALSLLVEAARRWPHLTERHLVPLLRERPELAIQAGASALSAIAAAPMVPLDVLAAIETLLPVDPPADLYAGIAAVTERLAADLSQHTIDPVRAARVLQKLGWRLLNSGRIADGIAMLTAAVDAARRLAAADRAAHAVQLEFSLRTVGRAHIRAQRWPEAAAALGEAVGLWSTDDVGSALPAQEIASCLADLSLALWHTGDNSSSLSIRHRAIAQLRRLVADHPEHRPTLIRALVQQAEQLRGAELGRGSLEALDEAVDLLRAVARNREAGLERDFADALLGRARTLKFLGRPAEAERPAAGAVRIFRQLAGLNVSYDQDLARALGTEAEVLAVLGRWPAAIDARESAIAIHRRLARINTDRYGLDLVRELIAFARLCRDAGRRHQEALAVLAEVIELLRADRFDDTIRHRLLLAAQALGADLLDASGRPADAEALRRPGHVWQPEAAPQSRSRREEQRPTPDERDRKLGKAIGNLAPYLARIRLEVLSAQRVAAVLVTMNPRPVWLELTFRGFQNEYKAEVLEQLVRYEELIKASVVLRFTAKRLQGNSAQWIAELLEQATPATAAAVLSYFDWPGDVVDVLGRMDQTRSAQISPLIN